MIYKLVKNIVTGEYNIATRELEGGKIEVVSTQSEEYLKWLAEGNEPLPPDNNQ